MGKCPAYYECCEALEEPCGDNHNPECYKRRKVWLEVVPKEEEEN